MAINLGSAVTPDGLETVFGVNFIGHFVLTTELLPLILSTPGARCDKILGKFFVSFKISYDGFVFGLA